MAEKITEISVTEDDAQENFDEYFELAVTGVNVVIVSPDNSSVVMTKC